MKSEQKDLTRLQHILKAIYLIEKFSSDLSFDKFNEDLIAQNAIVRQFEIIGEAIYHISSSLKEDNSKIDWEGFRTFRNLLTHEYFRIDVGNTWSVMENDLPVLKIQIQSLIEELKDE